MKTKFLGLVCCVSLLLLSFPMESMAGKTRFPTARQLPPLEDLEASVLRNSGLDPQRIQDWEKKARWSAALPRVQVGWESNFLNQNTNVIQDSISVTSSGVTVGPESSRLDLDVQNNRDLEVTAVWALDELVFNRDQLNISREARDLFFVRTKLLDELHQTYFDLKSLLLQQGGRDFPTTDAQWALQVERRMEKLNSLTGGEFRRLLENQYSSGEKS